MALMPKRVKFRKFQRGKLKGKATKGQPTNFQKFSTGEVLHSWFILMSAPMVVNGIA